jgi:hypothetical protein
MSIVARFKVTRPLGWGVWFKIGALVVVLAALSGEASAQIRARPTVDVLRIWGGSYGWGVPVGVRIEAPGGRTAGRIDTWTAEHIGRYTAEARFRRPQAPGLYAHASGLHEITYRRPFFGFGADAPEDGRVLTRLVRQEGWLRVGVNHPTGRGVHVFGAIRHLSSPRIVEDEGAVLPAADRALLDDTDGVTGVVYGLRLRRDGRDALVRPTRGILVDVQAERFVGVGGTTDQYLRGAAHVYGYVPLGRDATLALRAIAVVTDPRRDEEISYLLLPKLDNRYVVGTSRQRLIDHDLLVVSAELRSPSFRLPLLPFDGQLAANGSLGQVYHSLEHQFRLRVGSDAEGDGLALRPFAGIGGRLYPAGRDDLFVSGMIGTGTATFSIGKVLFENDTREGREVWR